MHSLSFGCNLQCMSGGAMKEIQEDRRRGRMNEDSCLFSYLSEVDYLVCFLLVHDDSPGTHKYTHLA